MTTFQRILPFLWVFFVVCAVAGGEYYFYRFSFDVENSFHIARAVTFASGIWSLVLVIGILMHRGWARYMMIFGLLFAIVLFGIITLLMNQESVAFLGRPTKAAVKGMGLFALAIIPLWASRSLQRYCGPLTAGGRTPL
jgi:phosphotransferase system  glucose/maltose/N-acetylglucosamine-specific IIC component